MTPAIRPQERLLVDLAAELRPGRLLCNTAGRAQFAAAYAARHSQATVCCWFLDLYQCEQSRVANGPLPRNLSLLCEADPPNDEVDFVAWAFGRQGDGELVREMLQTGHERLAVGGRLIVAIDNPRDRWLHEQLQNMFSKVTRRPSDTGAVYLATKTAPLRKVKTYAAEFAFRDGERLIQLRTRPGVFSHRELDGGARALIKAMPPCSGAILDLGCGSGAVGIAAVLRDASSRGQAIDSNPRAIEAVRWAVEKNDVGERMVPLLACDGSGIAPGSCDVVLANPPYYSDFRIAKLFVDIASRALVQRGSLLIVTKMADWYAEHLGDVFDEVTTRAVGQYSVVTARKKPRI